MPTILIVDDDPSQRCLIRAILEEDPSVTFLEAHDELQVLHLVLLGHLDLIIFDVGALSPERSYSRQQVEATRLMDRIPVIFIATWTHTNKSLMAILASGRSLLFKPFEAADLRAAVHHALKCPRQLGQMARPLETESRR